MMKSEIGNIDGTPDKRLFWSIISDYDLLTALCELIDNAIDFWVLAGRQQQLTINIVLDHERQLICVKDNAGGVSKENLRLLIAPGGSGNDPNDEVIGVFGVGSKRAGVALGETIAITTRHGLGKSYQLDISKDWLLSEDWDMPLYEIDSIDVGSTSIDISEVRRIFTEENVISICTRIGEIYSKFIDNGCDINLNGSPVPSIGFATWAFPDGYPPRRAPLELHMEGVEGDVSASITGGLILDRDPDGENYGMYFYCNDRLIVKELKHREVGYNNSQEAGVPHPDASLARVIVELKGPARAMPWNSSKSEINFDHPIFLEMRPTIVSQMGFYSKLSRRLKNEWESSVFSKHSGEVDDIDPEDLGRSSKVIQPPLPRVRRKRLETLLQMNKSIIQDQPWILGLVESMGVIDVIKKQRFDTKNRIALIILDSNFEISLKEFIVHRHDLFPPGVYNDTKIGQIFRNRQQVIGEVNQHMAINGALLQKANHYYNMRNKLIHERATLGVTDNDIESYKDTIEQILTILFGLRF